MKISIILLMLVIFSSSFHYVHAAQLDAIVAKDSEEFIPTFQFTRIITLTYDEDSKLQELIGSKQQKISFDIDIENASSLVDMINTELQQKSFAKVIAISGTYSAIVSPQEKSAGIEYRIALRPTITNHFVANSETLDSQWRGFAIEQVVPVKTSYGIYDINSPKSVLGVTSPDALEYISGSDAMKILDISLLDAQRISEFPLSKWESMFDPTAKMSETQEYGFSGNVITNYSMGICTVYLGVCEDTTVLEKFTIDDEQYTIRSIESQDDATIMLEGYVNETRIGDVEVFTIQDSAPSVGNENDMQVSVMYMMTGVGIAVAVGFFVFSDKKAKRTSSEQTGIDPKNLQAIPITEAAGSYQTNRGTAQLKR